MVGVMSIDEALRAADARNLELVEVNPKADPPVCRIMDFGKFKYETKKKQRDSRKRQTVVETKEVKFRPKTEEHDFEFKMRHIKRFLEEGNKAKITVRFRGREIVHPEKAQILLVRVIKAVEGVGVVEQSHRLEGKTMTLLIAPK